MHEAEKFQHNGFTVTIYYDPDPLDPRENDNLSVLACWHRRERLGDEQIEGMSAKEVIKRVRDSGDKILALLPLYLYQHSGMTMRCAPFSCPWDSGQVGWGYVTRSGAEKMGCVGVHHKRLDDGTVVEDGTWDKARLEDAIRSEVEEYDNFLTGQCYGYEVTDEDGDHIDSSWGFVGDLDYVRKEAKSAAEHAEPLGKVHGGCNASCAEGSVGHG